MTKEATYYEVHCDHCGARLELDDICAWETREEAEDAMDYLGWQEMESERVYCDSCLETDEITFGTSSDEDEE